MGMIKLRVSGTPAPQGSKRAYAVRGKGGVPTGRVNVVEQQGARVRSWRQAVVEECREFIACERGPGTAEEELLAYAYSGVPLSVVLVFVLPRPKEHYGTGRNAQALKVSAPPRPARQPDLDKLVRATLDALTGARVYRDDAQVVDLNASKVYAAAGEAPGAVIEICEAGGG